MLHRLPTWLRAALITGAQSFAGTVAVGLLGVLDAFNAWAQTGDPVDLSVFAKLVAGAATAAAAGVITAVVRYFKPVENTYPEAPKI